jgi:hypothetical protein
VYRSLCPRLDMDARIFLKKILLVYPKIQKLFKILCHMHGVLNINKSIPKSQNFSLSIDFFLPPVIGKKSPLPNQTRNHFQIRHEIKCSPSASNFVWLNFRLAPLPSHPNPKSNSCRASKQNAEGKTRQQITGGDMK